VNETILIDTGAWIALFDKRDSNHSAIFEYSGIIEEYPLLVPWPITYETLRTRFTHRAAWVTAFNALVSRAGVTLLDDQPYRDDAYALTVDYAIRQGRDISMVDMLCRLIIDDPNVKLDCVITTNRKDFADVCHARGVEIFPRVQV